MAQTDLTIPFDLNRPVRANRTGYVDEGLEKDKQYAILSVLVSGHGEQIKYLVQTIGEPSHGAYWVTGSCIYHDKRDEPVVKPDQTTCTLEEANVWLKHLVRSGHYEEALEWITTTESIAHRIRMES